MFRVNRGELAARNSGPVAEITDTSSERKLRMRTVDA